MSEPLLNQLAARLARPVDEDMRKRARLHLLDWLACVAGARQSEAGELGAVISHAGWERTTYLGNVLGFEDEWGEVQLRPGPVVWPAALSMASAAMDARLDAAIRGYEAMIAIGAALHGEGARPWNLSATCGVFGSCAGFGSLIGFAAVEYANALGNAGSVAGGLRHGSDGDLSTRQWQVYHAVRTGRDTAMHVHYGATGPLQLLEGENGLFAAMGGRSGALAELGDDWLITQTECYLSAEASEVQTPDEAMLTAKMNHLGDKGLLAEGESKRAVDIALRGDDAGELDALVDRWMGG